jgi:hypothetical protein
MKDGKGKRFVQQYRYIVVSTNITKEMRKCGYIVA